MTNLRAHLLWIIVAISTATVGLSSVGVYIVSTSAIQHNLDESILQLARTELASATDTGRVHVHESDPWTLEFRGVEGYEKYVWVEDEHGRVVARTANISPATNLSVDQDLSVRARGGHAVFGNIAVGGKPVRAVLYPFTGSDGEKFLGIVGVPLSVVGSTVESIGQVGLLIGFSCIALSAAIAVVVSGRVASPLSELSEVVEALDPEEPCMPKKVNGPYAEVGILSDAFERLSGRVRETLAIRAKTISSQRRFVADASHELRTPVSIIQGTLEVALRRPRTVEEYQDAMRQSLCECRRITRLVEDLLLLSKTDEGVFALVPRKEDVGDLVNLTARRILPPDLSCEVSAPLGIFAEVDAIRITQVVENLLRNAITHAKSQIRLTVRSAGKRVYIEVSNDGPELTPTEAERIFDRFTRLEHARDRDSGGSGLGLAIVKSLVEAHGGEVSAASSSGWTTFSVILASSD